MRPHARLHTDQAKGHVGEPRFDLAARPLLPQHDGPTSIQANNMERVLPDIDADYGNSCLTSLSHRVLLLICAPASLMGDGAEARADHPISGNSAMSESCLKLRGELLYRRTLANEEMVNRVGSHKCGVTLWQM
jgi:hypothetical protein